MGYAGAEDIPAIAVPRPLIARRRRRRRVRAADRGDPGPHRGHVSVLDEAGGILVAGDALGTSGGKPTPPDPGFTEDMDTALASIAKLGSLAFETLLVGPRRADRIGRGRRR